MLYNLDSIVQNFTLEHTLNGTMYVRNRYNYLHNTHTAVHVPKIRGGGRARGVLVFVGQLETTMQYFCG